MLLYRRESWVNTEAIIKALDEFHHCINRRITVKTVWCVREELWEFPPTEEAIEAAGCG